VGPAAPLAPSYPAERYQQPVSEVSPDLPAAASRSQPGERQPKSTQPRKPRGVVVLTIGLPGSGKSSWFKRRGVAPLSSDMLRSLLFDDIGEQRYQDLVFSTLRSLLRARLIAGMPWNYIDATNLSPKERHGWIKMAREFGYEVHAVFFNVPLEVCQERNQKRSRVVPDDVMQRMANKLRPPTFEEGFSKIIVVRVKRADQEPQSQAEEPPGGTEGESAD
jgi:predicted kinase